MFTKKIPCWVAKTTSWSLDLVFIIAIILPVLCFSCSLIKIWPSEILTRSKYPCNCPQRIVSSSIWRRQKMCFLSLTSIVVKKLTGSNRNKWPFVHPTKMWLSLVTEIAHLIYSPSKILISLCFFRFSKSKMSTSLLGPHVNRSCDNPFSTLILQITRLICCGMWY